jgi:hypothetical protein
MAEWLGTPSWRLFRSIHYPDRMRSECQPPSIAILHCSADRSATVSRSEEIVGYECWISDELLHLLNQRRRYLYSFRSSQLPHSKSLRAAVPPCARQLCTTCHQYTIVEHLAVLVHLVAPNTSYLLARAHAYVTARHRQEQAQASTAAVERSLVQRALSQVLLLTI